MDVVFITNSDCSRQKHYNLNWPFDWIGCRI